MRAGRYNDAELEEQLDKRGLMNRFLGPIARRADAPWKMYPIGVLFGLGFDTATEVALLVLAGSAVVSGLPFYAILSLPILFAAGMCLFDTVDGCFMNFAYDWAFAKPVRKVYYNMTITGLSVFVALFIGTIEILGLIGQEYEPRRRLLDLHGRLQHQQGRLRHRRHLRHHLDRRPRHLAFRQDRAEVGRAAGRGRRRLHRGIARHSRRPGFPPRGKCWQSWAVRLIDRLSQPQQIVIVIALGVACVAIGTYISQLGESVSSGWYAYAPLTASSPDAGLHGWLVLIIWLVLAGLWALASIRLLRPASREPAG